ncbi:hypothetical protein [Legionella sp. WA2024007413]
MSFKTLIFLLVLLSTFGSAIWNIQIKQSSNNVVFVTLMVIPQFMVAAPLLFIVPLLDYATFSFVVMSAIVQTGYILFLSNAYKHGLVSAVYPLAVGSAPLFALYYWHHYVGYPISTHEFVGVVVLSLGIISFIFTRITKKSPFSLQGIAYAIGTGVFIFSYSTIDTYGIRAASNPLSYISWLFVLKAFLLFLPMLLLKKITWETLNQGKKKYIIAGLLAGLGYSMAVFAFLHFHSAVILGLRSTSILFVFFLSIFILKEKTSVRTLFATLLTITGMSLILVG